MSSPHQTRVVAIVLAAVVALAAAVAGGALISQQFGDEQTSPSSTFAAVVNSANGQGASVPTHPVSAPPTSTTSTTTGRVTVESVTVVDLNRDARGFALVGGVLHIAGASYWRVPLTASNALVPAPAPTDARAHLDVARSAAGSEVVALPLQPRVPLLIDAVASGWDAHSFAQFIASDGAGGAVTAGANLGGTVERRSKGKPGHSAIFALESDSKATALVASASLVAVGTDRGAVRTADLNGSGSTVVRASGECPVIAVAIDSTQTKLAVLASNGDITLYRLSDRARVASTGPINGTCGPNVETLTGALLFDGGLLIGAGSGPDIRVLRATNKGGFDTVANLVGHDNTVVDLGLRLEDQTLVSMDRGGHVLAWPLPGVFFKE